MMRENTNTEPGLYILAARVSRLFRRYHRLIGREQDIIYHRGSRRGLAVDDDPGAIEWQQQISWRKEVIKAFFEGRKPSPFQKRWYKPEAK